MLINVHTVEYDGGTVAVGIGTNEDGKEVRFGGDWRPMRDLAALVEEQGEIQAEVEDWQVLSTAD